MAQLRQVNHQAVLTRAETCKAVPSASDSGNNSALSASPHRVLYIAYICAARNQSGLARNHAIPYGARVFIAAVGGAQQVAFESPAERRVDLFAGFGHRGISLRGLITRYQTEITARKTENAGTDHSNPSTKKVVTEIATNKIMPSTVKSGCARRRIGKLNSRSLVMVLRKRKCVLRITSHTKSIPATAVPYNIRKAFFGAKMASRIAAIIPAVEAIRARFRTPF